MLRSVNSGGIRVNLIKNILLSVAMALIFMIGSGLFVAMNTQPAYAETDYSSDTFIDDQRVYIYGELYSLGFTRNKVVSGFENTEYLDEQKILLVAEYRQHDYIKTLYQPGYAADIGEFLDEVYLDQSRPDLPLEDGTLTVKLYTKNSDPSDDNWYLAGMGEEGAIFTTKIYGIFFRAGDGGSLNDWYTRQSLNNRGIYLAEDEISSVYVDLYIQPDNGYDIDSLSYEIEPTSIYGTDYNKSLTFAIDKSMEVTTRFKIVSHNYKTVIFDTLKDDANSTNKLLNKAIFDKIKNVAGLNAVQVGQKIYMQIPSHWDNERLFTLLQASIWAYNYDALKFSGYKLEKNRGWAVDNENLYHSGKTMDEWFFSVSMGLKKLQDYESVDEWRNELVDHNTITNNQTIYLSWQKRLTTVKASIKVPTCGTTVFLDERWGNGSPQPVVENIDGYHVETTYWVKKNERGKYEMFGGPIEVGETYTAWVRTQPRGFAYIGGASTQIMVNGDKACSIEKFENQGHVYLIGSGFTVDLVADHDWEVDEVLTEPTCTTPGKVRYKCKACNVTKIEDAVIDENAHDWGEWEYESEATHKRVCKNDPAHVESVPHEWELDQVTTEPSCTSEGEGNFKCKLCDAEKTDEIGDPDAHDWNEWVIVKEATAEEEGLKERTCKNDPEHKESEVIPKTGGDDNPGGGDNPGGDDDPSGGGNSGDNGQGGNDGSNNGGNSGDNNGGNNTDNIYNNMTFVEIIKYIPVEVTPETPAPLAAVDAAIMKAPNDNDIKGSTYAPLKLMSKKQKKNSIKLQWSKVKGGAQYTVYGSLCGKGKYQKIKTLKGKSLNVKKLAGKKLKKGKPYKFLVIAESGDKVVAISKTIHVSSGGKKKVGNHNKVTVSKKVIKNAKKLKAKKSLALKAKAVKKKGIKVFNHAKVRYESSNKKVVTVSKSGKVKAIKKGTAKIYAYAQNGINKTVKVKVK